MGLRLSGEVFDDGTGGFMPIRYPRLFDTSAPVNGEGHGTPNLTGDSRRPTKFLTPVEELVQIGLMTRTVKQWNVAFQQVVE